MLSILHWDCPQGRKYMPGIYKVHGSREVRGCLAKPRGPKRPKVAAPARFCIEAAAK
jgi:hypothetical protein